MKNSTGINKNENEFNNNFEFLLGVIFFIVAIVLVGAIIFLV